MEENRVHLFYEEMKHTYIKTESDWNDKKKTFRTLLEDFFNNILPNSNQYSRLQEKIDAYYNANPDEEFMRSRAHKIRISTNHVVHNDVKIGKNEIIRINSTKSEIRDIYEECVMIIYNATGVIPDSATFEFLGKNKAELLKGLNEQQKYAILIESRIVFVNAGPGTGKTTLLVKKMVHYVTNNSKKNNIVALSFTNTAARQLEDKFLQQAFLYLREKDYGLVNGTIHSYCLRKLRTYYQSKGRSFEFIVIDDEGLYDLVPDIHRQMNDRYTIEEINIFLNNGFRHWPDDLRDTIEDLKKRYKLITLNGILTQFYDHLSNDKEFSDWVLSSVDLLLIDEAQDLNKNNFEIFNKMLELKPSLKLFMVGDPRQNIFEFNGGSYEYLNIFLQEHQTETKCKDLGVSYRCPSSVLEYVNNFNFADCQNTPLKSNIEGGTQAHAFPTIRDESNYIISAISSTGDYDSCAVLSHSIKGLADIITCLNENEIPYTVLGGKRKLKAHIKFVNNLLKILYNKNERSIIAAARMLNIDVKTQPVGAPRNFSPTELFYRNAYGRKLRATYTDYSNQEWDFGILVNALIDDFLPCSMYSDNTIMQDFEKFRSLVSGYKSIKEYLDAFSLNKDRFLTFYEKDFVESVTPAEEARVTLSTIHSAKGLEWKNVFIIGMNDQNFPGTKNQTSSMQDKYLNTKRKELYVACTRASEQLCLSFPMQMDNVEQIPSRFLTGLDIK